ncbi:hypothetical protein [Sulfurovum sp. AR]|uniref:hypothetical protein n=1 Tax=Sulfurovum sp. AR TaxID=1165841 RepID=UPI00025C4C85|nr:hypothetical protein [Sulfurovum sp. AR]EIF51993.1 hypothetical protein SULAR_00760 [Sulfurovum sp. AR]
MLIKKILWILALLISTLFGSVDFPQVYTVFKKTDDADRIKKIVLSKDQKRLLVMRHNSVSLMDAKNFKVIKKITFKGSAWDCDFAEEGFVLLTHHDFTYYDDTGTNRLYYTERRDGGQIAKMDMRKNGYIVNLIKEIDRPKKDDIVKRILEMQRTGNTANIAHLNQSEKRLVTLNLRTKEYKETIYKTDFKAKHYLNDIRDNVLKISTGSHTYDYINVLTGTKVKDFPGENILPNGKQIIDAKELILQDITQKKVIQSYTKPAGRFKFGCMDPSGKRFAILTINEPVYVYDINKSEPIFSLPRNLNTSKTRNCLLYDDTLILWGKSMQAYNIKDANKIENAVSRSLEVMPIIGSCTDASYGVSLWVNTMYGWDVEKGQMLWYSIGPEFNRSHWENASYLIKMQSDDKIAFVQPYGQRAFKELRVNLENGTFIEQGNKKREKSTGKSIICDPGSGEVWLEKEFSFTHNGVSFYALSQGEWLVISNNDGYFNASSKDALSLLHKDHKALTDEDIEKWYRPDIIQAKLSNKIIEELSKRKTNFKLPEKSQLTNQYFASILQGVKTGNNYDRLMQLLKLATLDQISQIVDAIPNDEKGYFYFYRALSVKKFRHKQPELFSFLDKRVENLSSYSNEVPALLEYLMRFRVYKKTPEFRKKKEILIESIWTKYKDNERVKLMIASMRKTDEAYTTIYWDVWEQEDYITKEHLEILYEENPLRAQKLAVQSLTNLLKKLDQLGCKEDQLNTNICQDDFEMKTYGTFRTRISTLYDFLITDKTAVPLDPLKRITAQKVKTFYADNEADRWGINAQYIKFYAKYSNEVEKKELIKSTKDFLEKAIFQTDWKQYWNSSYFRDKNSKIKAIHKGMLETMPKYFLQLESRIIASDNRYLHEHLDYLITDIEKNPFVQKAMIQSILEEFHDNGYVDYQYIGRLLNTNSKEIHLQVIDMFNQFKDCNKIRDNYRYKLKRVLSLKEYMRLECDPLSNESIPYNKQEEYAPLYKTMQK